MIKTDTLIIGGGPAGAACAWRLQQQRADFLLLEKATFPRFKPCAGWITPAVLRDVDLEPGTYPGGLTRFHSFELWLKDLHFTLPVKQYAIRRIEFDDWLLNRVKEHVIQHDVERIERAQGGFVVDGEYHCRQLVGAGGTYCPVRRAFKGEDRPGESGTLIAALEEEFEYPQADPRCHLWFLQNGLPGYAWYVPKVNSVVNVGIGASAGALKDRGMNLKHHWQLLVEHLEKSGLVRGHEYKTTGHTYHLRARSTGVAMAGVYLVGDALGLATLDMGEGIGPAIRSGINAANAILENVEYRLTGVLRYSFPSLLGIRK
jgi:flavin-dependent dehydrogenase